ncbi:MAG: TlpA family protein disulfide reductase [Lachnospiraceae bacterium]|nr:TlpA family protein disulfide reductase [Lachnospiraceae bacterium]
MKKKTDINMSFKNIKFVVAATLMSAVILSGCAGSDNNAGNGNQINAENDARGNNANGNKSNDSNADNNGGTGTQDKARRNAAPDFTTELADGSTFTLSSAKGKVVLINIWATWCGPCCGEMPAFQKLYEEYGDKMQIVAVNYAEPKEDVKQFLKENEYTFPVAFDENAEVAAKYPSQGIPYTIIVDKDGAIYKTFVGAQSAEIQYDIYKKAIEGAMNE